MEKKIVDFKNNIQLTILKFLYNIATNLLEDHLLQISTPNLL